MKTSVEGRIDPKIMDELNLHERDLIEINGEKKTVAIALPSQTDITYAGRLQI